MRTHCYHQRGAAFSEYAIALGILFVVLFAAGVMLLATFQAQGRALIDAAAEPNPFCVEDPDSDLCD